MKTLAIRLEDDMHAQLSMIAQLEELTVTDAIRQAIESWIEAKRSNPELSAKAEAVLADIERDAASRRDAIASLFESGQPKAGGQRRNRREAPRTQSPPVLAARREDRRQRAERTFHPGRGSSSLRLQRSLGNPCRSTTSDERR